MQLAFELQADFIEGGGLVAAPVYQVEQVAAEGHGERGGEFSGFECVDGGHHPGGEVRGVHPAEIAADLGLEVGYRPRGLLEADLAREDADTAKDELGKLIKKIEEATQEKFGSLLGNNHGTG